jgi:transposase
VGVHRAVPADRRVWPYPERLRQQFEGVIWRFKTGGQWREMPQEFGAWSTVSNRFRQWRAAGVFEALLEGLIAEAEEEKARSKGAAPTNKADEMPKRIPSRRSDDASGAAGSSA